MSLLPIVIAIAAVALYQARKAADASSVALPGPHTLQAGVRYLFIVRLDPSVTDTLTTQTLEQKGATEIVFDSVAVDDGGGRRRVSFAATPRGTSTVELGQSFYDLGTLERIVRLDGRPFDYRALS